MITSLCLFLPLTSTCFPPCLSLSSPTRAMVSSWQQMWGGGSHCGLKGAYLLPPSLQAKCQMPPLHSFLTTWSRGSVFCCSWTALSKSLSFALSVCAARLTKTHTAFFQPEVLVLAPSPAPSPPFMHTHHPLQPPHLNTKYFIFEARSRR